MARELMEEEMDQDAMFKAFNNAPGGGLPAVPGSTTIDMTDGIITARKVDVPRDDGKVLQRIATYAAWAGTSWIYSYPVKNRKKNRVDTIEGLSIKGANAVARLYGNCSVDCRIVDRGDSWLIYAKFSDYEAGYQLVRPFQQNKEAGRIGGDDDSRRRDMALSTGVSKAERNVVIHALQFFADHAFESAKRDLVGRIGKDLKGYKQRMADKLADMGVTMDRVERTVGKGFDAWVAKDAAKVTAEISAVVDGMATAEEQWPMKGAPAEPRRNDRPAATDVPAEPAPAPEPELPLTAAPPEPEAKPQESAQPDSAIVPDWTIPAGLIGQDAVLLKFQDFIEAATTEQHLDLIAERNAESLAKITGVKRMALNDQFRAKREQVKAAP